MNLNGQRSLTYFNALFAILVTAFSVNSFAKEDAQQMMELLQSTLNKDNGPGLMVAVVKNGTLVYSKAVGLADVEQQIPLTTDTKMRIGSVSKVITAAASLKMAEQGELDIHADIQKYGSSFPKKQWSISPIDLATHTSGIRHYNFDNYFEANNVRFYTSLEEAVAVFSHEPLKSKPGDQFEYSSLGYNLLGVVLEKAGKQPFPAILQSYVTEPLNLSHTVIDHPLMMVPKRTRFYTVSELHNTAINTIWRDSSDYYPSGGILSTAEDLANFTYSVFATDFLSDKSKNLKTREITTSDGKSTGYAYGWQVSQEDGTAVYSHGGETNGAYAHVRFYPEHNMAIAGITNYNFWGQGLGEAKFFELVRRKLPEFFL